VGLEIVTSIEAGFGALLVPDLAGEILTASLCSISTGFPAACAEADETPMTASVTPARVRQRGNDMHPPLGAAVRMGLRRVINPLAVPAMREFVTDVRIRTTVIAIAAPD
jgi:hypothetical protein